MKNSILIKVFILQFFFHGYAIAQITEIDSLQRLLPSLNDTARIDCMNGLSFQYIRLLKRDSAQYFQTLAYKESKRINYVHGVAEAIANQSGIFTYFDNDFIKAEVLARQSLYWFEKSRNKAKIENARDNLNFAVFAQSKYDEAYQIAAADYEKGRIDNNKFRMHDALVGMSVINYQKGNYDSAFYLNEQSQQIAIAQNNKAWISMNLFHFGRLYRSIGDYQTALKNYRQVFLTDTRETIQIRIDASFDTWTRMEFAELFGLLNQFDSAWHYYHLFDTTKITDKDLRIYLVSTGETLMLQKDYRRALQNFQRGLIMHRKLNDINEIKRVLLDIAKIYLEINNYPAALKYAKEGLSLSLQTNSRQFIRDGYRVLYSVYDRLHKTDSAYFYYQKYISIKDIVVSDQTKGKFAAYRYEQQINSLNNESIISQQKLKIQQQQLVQASMQKKISIAALLILLFISGVVVRTILLKRKNEKNRRELAENELKIQKLETQKQLSELEMQALRAQMNPHFIFNSLNSINRFILQNNRAQASAYLTKFSRLVRLILQNSQAALITLESELESLQLYLELEAVRFDHHFDYNIKVADDLDTSTIKVPPLIIQPYAENAIWHGLMHKEEKGHLEIELFQQKDVLCCRIADDGIGRKKAAELKSKTASTHKSMGMQITASRIEMLQHNKQSDAYIKITDLVLPDGSAGGTEVIIKIPALHE